MNILHSFLWRMQLQDQFHICKVNATRNDIRRDQDIKPQATPQATGLEKVPGRKMT